jgi:hypothetical protein
MPFPSLHRSEHEARNWSLVRAGGYGAAIGAAAAAFKTLGPPSVTGGGFAGGRFGVAAEIVGAALVFALLCMAAAALRNILVRRLS